MIAAVVPAAGLSTRMGQPKLALPLGERTILRLNVYNVTDRVYIRNINNNAGRYNPGAPRSFLLSTAIRV